MQPEAVELPRSICLEDDLEKNDHGILKDTKVVEPSQG